MIIFRKLTIFLLLSCLTDLFGPPAVSADAEEFRDLPVKGVVTMIDLGADKCIPCKMMAPIMAKLEKAYEGKAAIVFIDVWKHNEQADDSASGLSRHRYFIMKAVWKYTAMSVLWERKLSSTN